MMLNKIFKYSSIYMIILSIMTACSSMKNINYDKNIPLNQYNKHYKYDIQDKQKFTEDIQLKIQKLHTENTIYFALNQYSIFTQFFYILDNHANFLCNHPSYKVKIEGHADERGTPEYNIALGERRANSVKLYLQSKGVLSEQIFIISYGKEKPAVLGHNEQAYSKNRRAILIYHQ